VAQSGTETAAEKHNQKAHRPPFSNSRRSGLWGNTLEWKPVRWIRSIWSSLPVIAQELGEHDPIVCRSKMRPQQEFL
jgi:hypothetical protein